MKKCLLNGWTCFGALLLAVCGCAKETAAPTTAATALAPGAKLSIEKTQIDLGEVDFAKQNIADFAVRNMGGLPLKLDLSKKSCKCAEVEVIPAEIPPGQSGKVLLKWAPTPGQTGSYLIAADFTTNDLQQPKIRLEAKAQINPVVRVWPEEWREIDFGTLSHGVVAEQKVKVFSTKLADFQLEARSGHPGLKVSVEKLPAKVAVGDAVASCAYEVKLKTSDELPKGYFRENLILDVKGPQSSQLTIPVYAQMETGAIQVAPSEIHFRRTALAEGDVQKFQLRFVVPSDNEKVEVVKLEPSFLTADPPLQIRKGVWQITLKIPSGNAEAMKLQPDGFFEGKAILKTANASVPEVPVRLKWYPKPDVSTP